MLSTHWLDETKGVFIPTATKFIEKGVIKPYEEFLCCGNKLPFITV